MKKFIDPDECMTTHSMVSYLLDDLDSLSDPDFKRLFEALVEHSQLRNSITFVTHYTDRWDY